MSGGRCGRVDDLTGISDIASRYGQKSEPSPDRQAGLKAVCISVDQGGGGPSVAWLVPRRHSTPQNAAAMARN
jgi:hypothetical protein